MIFNEIKYVIYFDYIREIRKYLYDIENFLKEQDLYSNLMGVSQVSDEAEPSLIRLHIVKELDNKSINIIVSQISLTILIQYKDNYDFKNFNKEAKELENISMNLRNYFKSNVNSFQINFESLTAIISQIYKKANNISVLEVSNLDDEVRQRTSKEVNNELFFIEENIALKTYSFTDNTISPLLIKNKKENLLGWNVILFKEINNRLKYNNSVVDVDNELNFEYAIQLIKKSFEEDIND